MAGSSTLTHLEDVLLSVCAVDEIGLVHGFIVVNTSG